MRFLRERDRRLDGADFRLMKRIDFLCSLQSMQSDTARRHERPRFPVSTQNIRKENKVYECRLPREKEQRKTRMLVNHYSSGQSSNNGPCEHYRDRCLSMQSTCRSSPLERGKSKWHADVLLYTNDSCDDTNALRTNAKCRQHCLRQTSPSTGERPLMMKTPLDDSFPVSVHRYRVPITCYSFPFRQLSSITCELTGRCR